MRSNKKIKSVIYGTLFAGFLISAFPTHHVKLVEARTFTSSDVRIAVVRPSWWKEEDVWQVMRVADSADSLINNQTADITYINIDHHVFDTFYSAEGWVENKFEQYDTDGVVFYDLEIDTILNKYFDLARVKNIEEPEVVLHNTEPEKFVTNLNTMLWRISGDKAKNEVTSIYRPGSDDLIPESRNVSNGVINELLFAYLTASESIYNGHGAFGALDHNFNLSSRRYTDNDKVLDFINKDDYSVGRFTGNSVYVLTSAKVAMMKALYINLTQGPTSTGWLAPNAKILIKFLALSFASIGVMGGFYFYILKRKSVIK